MFYKAPEFNEYLKSSDTYDESLALNVTQTAKLLNRSVTEAEGANTAIVQSLLNPENIHVFFYDYIYKDYDSIKTRFALASN